MGYYLGIDIGTTAVKAVVVDGEGRIRGENSAAHLLSSPHPGWAEEDAGKWWDNVCRCVKALDCSGVEAVAVSGMVPALVLLDGDGRVLRPTIQQNDARCTAELDELTASLDQRLLYRRTGGYTNQQHVAPRLLWVERNEPEIWERTATVVGSYDYIAYRLTGELSLELNFAAESGMFDIRSRRFVPEYLPREGLFPRVREPWEIVGRVADEVAAMLGLPPKIPVLAGSADHVASAYAAGLTRDGDMLIKFGGAGDMLYCSDALVTDPRLFFDYHLLPGKYLINGCMAASGSMTRWFVEGLLGLSDYAALDREAARIPPGSDGLVILPYFLGEKTPIFDTLARGCFVGLTLSHTRAHIFRAMLEAVIFGFRHHVEVLSDMGLAPKRVFASNGGAKSAFWCQIAADVLNLEVLSYPSQPGSAYGAALLAARTVGRVDESKLEAGRPEGVLFRPDPAAAAIYDRCYAVYRGLYGALRPSFTAISSIYRKDCDI